jgi:hypothetical protein
VGALVAARAQLSRAALRFWEKPEEKLLGLLEGYIYFEPPILLVKQGLPLCAIRKPGAVVRQNSVRRFVITHRAVIRLQFPARPARFGLCVLRREGAPSIFCGSDKDKYSAKNLQDHMQRVADLGRRGEVFAYFQKNSKA